MPKWIRVVLVVALAVSLLAGVFGHGIASAKSPKPQDPVKKFMTAAAGLKATKASSYWVPEERTNVSSQLSGVASGTKISLSKLKLMVTSQTSDTAGVNATYNIKIKVKGKANVNKSNEQATFALSKTNNTWLISSSDIWSKEPWNAASTANAEIKIFNNGNIGGVDNNPTSPTTFTLTKTYKITLIEDYHWNYGQGASPGTIGLTDNDGNAVGTWNVTTKSGQGGVANAVWDAAPNVVIGPGTYTVVDSDPATWSQNSQSNNQGFTLIKGVAATSAVSSTPTPTGTLVATTPLVSKELEPSANAQLVSYQDKVGVIISGGTLESTQTVTISPAPDLPAPPFPGFTELAAYNISMGDVHEFNNPLIIEVAYDPNSIPSELTPDKALSVGYWDTDQNEWISTPFAVDTTRNVVMIPTTHLTCWKIWAKAKGWDWKENDHFVVFYDPNGTVLIGGKASGTTADLAERVGTILGQAYTSYATAGFNMSLTYVPASAIGAGVGVVTGGIIGWLAGGIGALSGARAGLNVGGKIGTVVGAVVVGSKTNVFLDKDTKDPNWSRYTGDISVPLDFDNYDQLSQELRHELFHAVQNSYFTIQGMDSRRWWMEATADYAAYKVAGPGSSASTTKISHAYFTQPLSTVNNFHEYQTANFVDYLVGTGTDPGKQFKEMFEAVAKGDASVITPLGSYIKDKTGKTLAEQYRDFAAHAIFDSSGPLEELKTNLLDSSITEGPQLFKAADTQLSHGFSLKGNYTAGVWGFKVEPKDATTTTRAINIETNGNLPADVLLNVYVLKNDQRPQGGVNPAGTLSITAATDDVVYIVATNGTNSDQDITAKVSDAPVTAQKSTVSASFNLSWQFENLAGDGVIKATASGSWQATAVGAKLDEQSAEGPEYKVYVDPDSPINLTVSGSGNLGQTSDRMDLFGGGYATATYEMQSMDQAPGQTLLSGTSSVSGGSANFNFTVPEDGEQYITLGFNIKRHVEYYDKDGNLQDETTDSAPAGGFDILFVPSD